MAFRAVVCAALTACLLPTVVDAGIYLDHKPIDLTDKEKQGIVATLTILLFILMATEITGPEVLFLIALMVVTLAEIITLSDALSGFANESMITIGTLFLVVGAVERSHVVDWMARKTFGSEGSALWGKIRMYCSCFALSIFFNNTPLVAILLPVVKDWGRMRGIAASQLLIPLSYSVLAGSFISMIGTSTNLTVQGLMQDDRGFSFDFFAPAPFGLPCFAALLVYQLCLGPYLLPGNRSGLIREVRDKADTLIAEVYVSEHSSAVGRSLGDMMNSLGVAPSAAIKIRRVLRDKEVEGADADAKPDDLRRSSSILDREYLRQRAQFWLARPDIPDRLDGGAGASPAEAAASADASAGEVGDVEQQSARFHDLVAPSQLEPVCAGDVVFISSAQDAVEKMMKSILGESRGLYILRSNVMALPGFGTEVLELVVSDTNPFLGRRLCDISAEFAERYSTGLITVRAKDWNLGEGGEGDEDGRSSGTGDEQEGAATAATAVLVPADEPAVELTAQAACAAPDGDKPHRHHKVSISDHVLQYGDCVLAVTSKAQVAQLARSRDFFVVSSVGDLPRPISPHSLFPVAVFVVMLVMVALEFIEMCPAALTVTAFFFAGGWITPDDIPKMVDIRLLMLMGCSLSFAKSMTKSGLALEIAGSIGAADPSPFGALLLVYAITLVITELISNNAAAALMYPIAVALADELGVSFKPFAMAVLLSSTAGFMSPIGYQTHVMVWGPGGYRFRDFVVFGLVPDLIYWFLGCALVPQMFPFDAK